MFRFGNCIFCSLTTSWRSWRSPFEWADSKYFLLSLTPRSERSLTSILSMKSLNNWYSFYPSQSWTSDLILLQPFPILNIRSDTPSTLPNLKHQIWYSFNPSQSWTSDLILLQSFPIQFSQFLHFFINLNIVGWYWMGIVNLDNFRKKIFCKIKIAMCENDLNGGNKSNMSLVKKNYKICRNGCLKMLENPLITAHLFSYRYL